MLTTGTVEGLRPPGGLFSGYVRPSGGFDELLDADGTLRPAWRLFAQRLEQHGLSVLQQRSEQARRLLRENGVTYNVFGAPQGPDRPWELDSLPLLISRREWQELESGLVQRVTLLNRILADVYGPQELLRRGVLPPELLFGNPAYLLACHQQTPAQGIYVHWYGGHLARHADGRWTVLADRAQGPSGAGFAVENRLILSRILPQDFEALHVERLASFFMKLRETLLGLAPSHRDNPRIVILSPGPRSATYFEDGYLARYLGYDLVEGGDLTVRGRSVFLKTLGGLLPVDVILRRVADDDCDPLELRGDSQMGVPGLLHAARTNHVMVANTLGSGFLESPALMAYLPRICRELFGEDLRLPSVDTWWCGDPASLAYVREHFEELVVRPAFLHRTSQPIVVRSLSTSRRQELLAKIEARPGSYAAHASVPRSTAPVWHQGALQPWRVSLRTFAVAHDGSYHVMPGGISRVSSDSEFSGESIASGQASKDVWVLADKPVEKSTLLRPKSAAVELRRSVNDLPSRAADNLFWLGRYAERAEGFVRHLRSVLVRMNNELDPASFADITVLKHALVDTTALAAERTPGGAVVPAESFEVVRHDLLEFLFDERRAIGVASTLQALRRTADFLRNRLSIDSWRIVHQLDLRSLFPWPTASARLDAVLLLLNHLLTHLSAFSGLSVESMTRGTGWRFLDMGRRIERALHTLELIQRSLVPVHQEIVTPLLEAVLEIADSTMTYRYRYLSSLQLAPVLDLIMVDETNPRAVGFQLSALAEHVRNLPVDDRGPDRTARTIMAAQASLRLCDVDAYAQVDDAGRLAPLSKFIEELIHQLLQVSDAVSQRYLTHTSPSHQLGVFAVEAAEGDV